MTPLEQYLAFISGRLSAESTTLPLDSDILYSLAQYADEQALRAPAEGFNLMCAAYAVADERDERLKAEAGYFFACAANHFDKSKSAESALKDAITYFKTHNDVYWLARCWWQQNIKPWMKNNFVASAEILWTTSEQLAQFNQDEANLCRLPLAYALMMSDKQGEALEQAAQCRAYFIKQQQPLYVALSQVFESAILIQSSRYDSALQMAQSAYTLFSQEDAPIGMARARERIAHVEVLRQNFDKAIEGYSEALSVYQSNSLNTRAGACYWAFTRTHTAQGNYQEAKKSLIQARSFFEQTGALGGVADTFIEEAVIEADLGNYQASDKLSKRASEIYTEIKSDNGSRRAVWHQAIVYMGLGYYQKAIFLLEEIEPLCQNEPVMHAQLMISAAVVWQKLNKPEQVATCLDKASQILDTVDGLARSSMIAKTLLARELKTQGAYEHASNLLADVINGASVEELNSVRHSAEILLAELKLLQNEPAAALPMLDRALDYHRTQNGTATQIAIHRLRAQALRLVNGPQAALQSLRTAYELSHKALPSLHWQLCADLGDFSAENSNTAEALTYYQEMADTIVQVRRGFTQPKLVADYLTDPLDALERAIQLAIDAERPEQALLFIESGKAQILLQQFSQLAPTAHGRDAIARLDAIRLKIQSIQGQLERTSDRTSEQYAQRDRMVDHYNAVIEQAERHQLPEIISRQQFDLASFRNAANERLDRWIALTYYHTKTTIYCAAITPTDVFVEAIPIAGRLRFALKLGADQARQRTVNNKDLQRLGDNLIPQQVWEYINAETHLLIAPHGPLHRIMWPALRKSGHEHPLVVHAIPTVTPSLHCMQVLWARHKGQDARKQNFGLVAAISQFGPEQADLPAVREEAAWLCTAATARILAEDEATWPNLLAVQKEATWRDMQFAHFATHAFFDSVAGRQSGFSLYDSDVWLHQIPELTPLPPLVFLSACSGSQRLVVTGDEQIGLPSTLLNSGAHTLVGSLWPVSDSEVVELTEVFYTHFLQYNKPSVALAWAQRYMLSTDTALTNWAGFHCLGIPH